jgi:hypothetical protein
VPGTNTDEGVRAVSRSRPIDPDGVRSYLEGKLGDDLAAVRAAMKRLARAYKPKELAEHAYALYEQFRPDIPAGKKGWGAKGASDLGRIVELAEK